jgi:hypothetical protein
MTTVLRDLLYAINQGGIVINCLALFAASGFSVPALPVILLMAAFVLFVMPNEKRMNPHAYIGIGLLVSLVLLTLGFLSKPSAPSVGASPAKIVAVSFASLVLVLAASFGVRLYKKYKSKARIEPPTV